MIGGLVLLLMISSLPGLLDASPPPKSLVKPNCTDFKCGNFTIPYPFGMGEACYASSWYSINCNHSKPFLNHTPLNLEVLNISLAYRTVTVNSPIFSFWNNTKEKRTGRKASIDLNKSPFWFSSLDNIFMVLGDGSARFINQYEEVIAGCGSICESSAVDTKVSYGINCCQTTIPSRASPYFQNYSVNFARGSEETGCGVQALVVDGDWFSRNFSSQAIIETRYAPLVLLWWGADDAWYASNDNSCGLYYDSDAGYYYRYPPCTCAWSEEGNPHLIGGCHVVEACANCSLLDYGMIGFDYRCFPNNGMARG